MQPDLIPGPRQREMWMTVGLDNALCLDGEEHSIALGVHVINVASLSPRHNAIPGLWHFAPREHDVPHEEARDSSSSELVAMIGGCAFGQIVNQCTKWHPRACEIALAESLVESAVPFVDLCVAGETEMSHCKGPEWRWETSLLENRASSSQDTSDRIFGSAI